MEKFITNIITNHIDHTSNTINAIDITVCLIAIITQCTIAMSTCFHICSYKPSEEPSVDWKLKVLFSGAFLCAFIATMSDLVGNVLEEVGSHYPFMCYYIFFTGTPFYSFFLLSTLMARIHITFRGSMYQISSTMYMIFIGILSMMFIGCVLTLISATILDIWNFLFLLYWIGMSLFVLFIIGSALAVGLFLRNVSDLAKVADVNEKNVPTHPYDIALNKYVVCGR